MPTKKIKGKIEAWLKFVRIDIDGLISNINDLRATLPHVDSTPTTTFTSPNDYKIRCNHPLQIISGIFGTLMGWFNNRRLNNLRDQLQKVQGNQNWLLQVQTVDLHKIDELENLMGEVIYELHYVERIYHQILVIRPSPTTNPFQHPKTNMSLASDSPTTALN